VAERRGVKMGEIADDLIEGHSCSWCGIYFRRPHGFPVICTSCWRQYKFEHRGYTTKRLLKEFALQVAFEKEL